MRKINQRGQMNISFGWLFAIIVGAVILVLTIFGATKVIKTSQQEQTSIGAKELGVLLNPLETGFESATSTFIEMKADTRIQNGCFLFGNFGEQRIQLYEKSFDKWTEGGAEVSFENKYIFSRKISEGKRFYLFSKPFEFPFKVTDIIYLTSSGEKYCFKDAPEDIEDEINQLKQENLASNCTSPDQIKVCFEGGSDCDFNVNYDSGYVEKGQHTLYFEGDALMYAAIFSDSEIYECQIQRLLKRTKELSLLYSKKASLMLQRNCDTDLEADLNWLSGIEIEDSSDLSSISYSIDNIQDKNKYSYCKLW